MILTPHLLVGAVIGSRVKNYWAIFILAIISHFVLDALPHWEYASRLMNVPNSVFFMTTLYSFIDIFIGTILIYWTFRYSDFLYPALFGAFCAIVPDGLIFLYFFLQSFLHVEISFLHSLYIMHIKIHSLETGGQFLLKVATESIVTIMALGTILLKAKKIPFLSSAPRQQK